MGLKKSKVKNEEVETEVETPAPKVDKEETARVKKAEADQKKANEDIMKEAEAKQKANEKSQKEATAAKKKSIKDGELQEGTVLINNRKHTLYCHETKQAFRPGEPKILEEVSHYIEANLARGLLEYR